MTTFSITHNYGTVELSQELFKHGLEKALDADYFRSVFEVKRNSGPFANPWAPDVATFCGVEYKLRDELARSVLEIKPNDDSPDFSITFVRDSFAIQFSDIEEVTLEKGLASFNPSLEGFDLWYRYDSTTSLQVEGFDDSKRTQVVDLSFTRGEHSNSIFYYGNVPASESVEDVKKEIKKSFCYQLLCRFHDYV